ncbi:acetyl-CoA hydrolase/transferase C-terminal domain-containing protein [Mycobacterium sp.]|uniref:acetyl-CoA hydrolase/transferase C-terminal domain-containing protein n=1 Tax=Mycobacterium sp. TaxID=1785 RepID=UPI003D0E80FE
MTVALGDGLGALRALSDGTDAAAVLSAVAGEVGSIRLVLGWHAAPIAGLQPDAFGEVVALMPNGGMRAVLRTATARFVPTRLSGIGALLAGTLRPDVLITRLVESEGRLHFGSEVSWQRALIDSGVGVLAVVDTVAASASAEPPVNSEQLHIAGYCDDGPVSLPDRPPLPEHDEVADRVLGFIPEGARIQTGVGQLGAAVLRRAKVPLRLETGLLTDSVVDLDARGLLIGEPSATYLSGSEELYAWSAGRPILRGIDYTHDLTRLARDEPFFAVNTAIEVDAYGQVNVEGVGDKVFGGIGGHPDYCAAAAMSPGGASIIAMQSRVDGRCPLVERLSRPASTPAYDVDVIVTESGHADLRGASWSQRRRLITQLFNGEGGHS